MSRRRKLHTFHVNVLCHPSKVTDEKVFEALSEVLSEFTLQLWVVRRSFRALVASGKGTYRVRYVTEVIAHYHRVYERDREDLAQAVLDHLAKHEEVKYDPAHDDEVLRKLIDG